MNKDVLNAGEVLLGQMFKEKREDMGLTVEELALRMHIRPSTINGVESGAFQIRWRLAMQFLEALDLYVFFIPKDSSHPLAQAMREGVNPADMARQLNRRLNS